MYRLGQQVIYGCHGICRIVDIDEKSVDNTIVSFYVLEPCNSSGTRFYVPVDNQVALTRLSPLLNKSQLEELLSDLYPVEEIWESNENRRKQLFRNLLSGNDRRMRLSMQKALYQHKDQQLLLGKKFHQCDENFLKEAEKLICWETAEVLQISYQEAYIYITSKIK